MQSTKHLNGELNYPFAAIVGMPFTKRALILLAVDPLLKGVVIAAPNGTAKSVLGRGVADSFTSSDESCPVVEVPLNVSEERLFGGLDINHALSTGKRRIDTGLISSANGGILYVDDITLLEPRLTNQLLSVIDSGKYQIEREGISRIVDANFVLVASFNPDESELHKGLLDRIGMIVSEPQALSADERIELLRRRAQFDRDPQSFVKEYQDQTMSLRDSVESARRRLITVSISGEDRKRMSFAALNFGIEGSRAEIFAVRASRANAAFEGRAFVTDEDLKLAVKMVLMPRALIAPEPAAQPENRKAQDHRSGEQSPNPTTSPNDTVTESPQPREAPSIEDLIIEALSSELPADLEELWREKKHEYGQKISRRVGSTRHRDAARTAGEKRGKHVRSTEFTQNRSRVDLFATLRAAAPYQKARREVEPSKRSDVLIEKSDLRFKQFKRKVGSLFIFVVDASGSMALNRMNQAKGALASLLHRSYLSRDKVALITFRKDKADILLSPSQSVALAKRAVDSMPVGGATPLAAGLSAALEMCRRAQRAGIAQTPVILFTDGRANVSIDGTKQGVQSEIEKIAMEFRRQGIASVVIDTHLKFTSSGEGERLANMLGGRYSYLPRADAKSLASLIRADVER